MTNPGDVGYTLLLESEIGAPIGDKVLWKHPEISGNFGHLFVTT